MRKYQSMAHALVHSDRELNSTNGAVRTPVYQSVLYGYEKTQDLVNIFQGKQAGHVYGRQSTPSTQALENQIALLEGEAISTEMVFPGNPLRVKFGRSAGEILVR